MTLQFASPHRRVSTASQGKASFESTPARALTAAATPLRRQSRWQSPAVKSGSIDDDVVNDPAAVSSLGRLEFDPKRSTVAFGGATYAVSIPDISTRQDLLRTKAAFAALQLRMQQEALTVFPPLHLLQVHGRPDRINTPNASAGTLVAAPLRSNQGKRFAAPLYEAGEDNVARSKAAAYVLPTVPEAVDVADTSNNDLQKHSALLDAAVIEQSAAWQHSYITALEDQFDSLARILNAYRAMPADRLQRHAKRLTGTRYKQVNQQHCQQLAAHTAASNELVTAVNGEVSRKLARHHAMQQGNLKEIEAQAAEEQRRIDAEVKAKRDAEAARQRRADEEAQRQREIEQRRLAAEQKAQQDKADKAREEQQRADAAAEAARAKAQAERDAKAAAAQKAEQAADVSNTPYMQQANQRTAIVQQVQQLASQYNGPDRIQLKGLINRTFNQITGTQQQVKAKTRLLMDTLKQVKQTQNQQQLAYVCNELASKLVAQGKGRIARQASSAFAFAIVATQLSLEEPSFFSALFVGLLNKVCALTIPKFLSARDYPNGAAYLHALGYEEVDEDAEASTVVDGVRLESEEQWAERVAGYVTLYAAYMQVPAPNHPHGIDFALQWLQTIVDTQTQRIQRQQSPDVATATLLQSFLHTAAYGLLDKHRQAFEPLMNTVQSTAFLNALDVSTSSRRASKQRLLNFLENSAKQLQATGKLDEPEGRRLPMGQDSDTSVQHAEYGDDNAQ